MSVIAIRPMEGLVNKNREKCMKIDLLGIKL